MIQLPEYLFIVGGSCFTNTEVVSLSETETTVPNCLSNLADHENDVYNGAGGPLQYEGTGTKLEPRVWSTQTDVDLIMRICQIFHSIYQFVTDQMLPHVCGSNSDHLPVDECWRFLATANSWEKASDIPRDINRAGVAFQEDWGIIMAGGMKNNGDCCSDNVTYTTSGQYFENTKPMPESTYYFCATGINSTHIFVTGLGLSEKNTYMWSKWTNHWQKLPSMPTGRRYTGCGAIRREDGSNAVMVVGGYNDVNGRLDIVEMYLIEEEEWRTGLFANNIKQFGYEM